MLRISLFTIILAGLALIAVSCTVTPETYPIAKVGSKVITLKQIEEHPQFKNLVDEFVMKQVIEDTAAAKGVKVTDEKVNEEFDKMRKQFGDEQQWKDVLAAQGMTEKDVKDQIKSRLVLFELLKAGEKVTDADAKAEFDANPDYYRNMYAQEKNLTVDEAQNLKFEDMKDYLIDQIKLSRAYPKVQEMIEEMKSKVNIEYLYMSPEKRAEVKKREEEMRKKAEEEKKKLEPQTPPAENGSGQEAGKPAEGADKSKGEAEKPKPEQKKDEGKTDTGGETKTGK